MEFNRFDIVEVYAVFEWHWNTGGICERARARYYRRMARAEDNGQDDLKIPSLESTGFQLMRMGFKARPSLEYETLSDNGKQIYHELIRKYEGEIALKSFFWEQENK